MPRTSAALRPRRACPRSISRSIAHSRSRSVRAMTTRAGGRLDAADASAAAAVRAVLRTESVHGAGRRHGRSRCGQNRKPVAADNPFLAMQEAASRQIVAALDAWRDISETLAERTFLCGLRLAGAAGCRRHRSDSASVPRQAAKNPLHRELLQKRIAELKARIPVGRAARGRRPRAALCRHGARRAIDERGFEIVRRRIRARRMATCRSADFKALVREQFNMLLIDRGGGARRHSVDAAARCRDPAQGVRPDQRDIGRARRALRRRQEEIDEVARLFGVGKEAGTARNLTVVEPAAKAS